GEGLARDEFRHRRGFPVAAAREETDRSPVSLRDHLLGPRPPLAPSMPKRGKLERALGHDHDGAHTASAAAGFWRCASTSRRFHSSLSARTAGSGDGRANTLRRSALLTCTILASCACRHVRSWQLFHSAAWSSSSWHAGMSPVSSMYPSAAWFMPP